MSEALGFHAQLFLAGRRINDGMGAYVASQMVKAMLKRQLLIDGARVLILGLTFKENCTDLRNTRVVDVLAELRDYGVQVDVHDPCVDPEEALAEYGITLISKPEPAAYNGVILAVAKSIRIMVNFDMIGTIFCAAFNKHSIGTIRGRVGIALMPSTELF